MRALEQMGRPTGRCRRVGDQEAAALTAAGDFSPDREQKAHWHIAADILERYAPAITEPMFAAMAAEEDEDRKVCRACSPNSPEYCAVRPWYAPPACWRA